MMYQEFQPADDLKPVIAHYWKVACHEVTGQAPRPLDNETLPDNTISLVFINMPYLKGVRLLGPQIRNINREVFPGSIYFGVRFQPWISCPTLFQLERSKLINETVDTTIDFRAFFQTLSVEDFNPGFSNIPLFEADLRRLLHHHTLHKQDMIRFICVQLAAGSSIADIVHELPLSIRPIQKKFKAYTGLSMRQYATIHQLRETWRAILKEQQASLGTILDQGYYDQAHFINTFRKYMHSPHRKLLAFHQSIAIDLGK